MANERNREYVLSDLKAKIYTAILEYETKHSYRSQSTHRQKNITDIKALCNQATDKESLLESLEDYFSSDTYYTGLRDKSILEDLIVAAVFASDPDVENGLHLFGCYNPLNHPSMETTPNGATDGSINLRYNLEDFILYAIDKYTHEHSAIIKDYRQKDIEKIKEILDTSEQEQHKADNIRQYINSEHFKRAFNSTFKKYILTMLDYAEQLQREVATRTWETSNPTHPPKIMIFLHGWHDSVNAGDQLAHEAIKNGFRFITYDHRGHGKDLARNEKNISTDLLRIDFRKFLDRMRAESPDAEIALVGHSMGGAILTTEQDYINKIPSVKTVSLISPAVMSSVFKMISPVKIFYRNMHKDVEIAQHASNRFGGNGPSLFGLLNFMRKAAQALACLFSPQTKNSIQEKWYIYAGKKDLSVNYSEFESLPNRTNIKFFSRGDHGLIFGHRSGSANRKIIKDIQSQFSSYHEINSKNLNDL